MLSKIIYIVRRSFRCYTSPEGQPRTNWCVALHLYRRYNA